MLSFLSRIGQWFLGTKVEPPPEKVSPTPATPTINPPQPIEVKIDPWVAVMAKKVMLLIQQWDICAEQIEAFKEDSGGGIVIALEDAITSRELTFVISPNHHIYFSATDNVTNSRLAGIVQEEALQALIVWRSYMSHEFPQKGIVLG